MAAGAVLVFAGAALAAGVGTEPGSLSLSAATGALSSTPTWSTTDGCPANFQGSAQLAEFDGSGNLISRISPAVGVGITSAFSGSLDGPVGPLLATINGSGQGGITASNPGTEEWAVGCWSLAGATGSSCYSQSLFVSIAAGATTYSTSATAPAGFTSTQSPCTLSTTSPSASASASTSTSPPASASASTSPSPAATMTPTPTAPPISGALPSGAPATGVGGASGPAGPDGLLIALGAALFAASAAAFGVAIRRSRSLGGVTGQGDTTTGIL
jgi:hypothetical protein